MSEFLPELYFQILTEIIRVGDRLPFTCYIVLSQNHKVVPFLMAGDICNEDRLAKLRSFGHMRMYIKNEDKPLYFQYVENRVQGPEKEEVRKILQENIAKGNLTGVPMEGDQISSSLKAMLSESAPAIVVQAPPPEVSQEAWGRSPLAGVHGEILTTVREKVVDLEQQLKIRGLMEEEVKTLVRGVIGGIEEQLIEIQKDSKPTSAKIIHITSKMAEIIDSEILKITSRPNISPQVKATLEDAVAPFQKMISQFVRGGKGAPEEQTHVAQEVLKTGQSTLNSLRLLADEQDKAIFEKSLEEIFSSVEAGLQMDLSLAEPRLEKINAEFLQHLWMLFNDTKAVLKANPPEVTKAIDLLEKASKRFDQIFGAPTDDKPLEKNELTDGLQAPAPSSLLEIPRGSGLMDPELVESLQKIIQEQNDVITGLTERLKKVRPELTGILEQWMSFQAVTKRKLDGSDIIRAGTITKALQEFDFRFFNDINQERKALKNATAQLFRLVGKEVDDAPDDFESLLTPAGQTLDEQGQLEAPPVSDISEIERLRAENSILSSQIENAQTLASTTVEKNAEFEEMVRQSGTYTESLEQENEEIKKTLEEKLKEATEAETEVRRLTEAIEEANNTIYKNNIDLQSYKEKLSEREDKVTSLELDLNLLKGQVSEKESWNVDVESLSPKAKAALLAKEEKLKQVEKRVERLQLELDQQKKELGSTRAKMASFEAEKRDLAKRMDKLVIERETAHQHEKSLDLKINMSNNLLSQARKSINKLTSENEQLRQDRLKYINKTKNIIAEQKELTSRAVSLSNQAQAEAQKARAMAEQLENMKRREAESVKSVQSAQKSIEQLGAENRKLKNDLQGRSASENEVNLESFRMRVTDLEKKLENFKLENRDLQAQYAQEQKKAQQAESELRILKSKIKTAS